MLVGGDPSPNEEALMLAERLEKNKQKMSNEEKAERVIRHSISQGKWSQHHHHKHFEGDGISQKFIGKLGQELKNQFVEVDGVLYQLKTGKGRQKFWRQVERQTDMIILRRYTKGGDTNGTQKETSGPVGELIPQHPEGRQPQPETGPETSQEIEFGYLVD